MTFLRPTAALVVATFFLSGCGLNLLPSAGEASNVFDLSPKSTFPEELPAVNWQLVVEEPTASRAVNTDRIAIRPRPLEVGYLKGVRWSDRAPRMVQTLLVESFENSGKIVGVGRQAIGLRGNYDLKSELREFYAMYPGEAGRHDVVVQMNVKIVKQPSALIIDSETFERVEQARDGSVHAIVEAFDAALGHIMKRAVVWTLTAVEDYERATPSRGSDPLRRKRGAPVNTLSE